MKKIISKIVFSFMYGFIYIFGGKAYANKNYNPFTLLNYLFYQKILRINGRISWPVHRTSIVISPEKIQKGTRNPGMSMGCYIDGRNGIVFGKNVWIGPKVSIISMNHDLHDYEKYIKTDPIEIGDDCWLGANSIILPNVKLGKHIVVAAGAVVTKSFTDNNIVIGGNPAKVIKTLQRVKNSEN